MAKRPHGLSTATLASKGPKGLSTKTLGKSKGLTTHTLDDDGAAPTKKGQRSQKLAKPKKRTGADRKPSTAKKTFTKSGLQGQIVSDGSGRYFKINLL